jgi:adenylate cyclase
LGHVDKPAEFRQNQANLSADETGMSFFAELKRRNVFRVAAAYAVIGWLLIEVSDTVFPRLGLPEWTVTFVIVLLMLGFPLALLLSWVYEITPDGLRREQDADRGEARVPQNTQALDRVIIGLLLLAVAYFAAEKFLWSSPTIRESPRVAQSTSGVNEDPGEAQPGSEVRLPDPKSIAVLPFVNMSSDTEQEYFSDGLAEELLNLLAKIPELRVAARTSSFSLKGEALQIAEVGEILKVAHVLEGSVRKSGDRVRITAQLVRADDGYHLWSQTFDRTLENIFAIQDEIAAAVVQQLRITLLGEVPQVREVNPDAYALFLEARHLARLQSVEGFRQSDELYAQALAIDPDYPSAWLGLAANYVNQADRLRPRPEAFLLAREAVGRALEVDPEYARAHSALGWIAMDYDDDLAAAARHFERALALDPADVNIIGNAGVLLRNLGRLEEAVALEEYVVARDPISPVAHNNLATSYRQVGRVDDAIASARTTLRLSPDYLGAHASVAIGLVMKGEPDAALAEAVQEIDRESRAVAAALALHALGRDEEYAAALRELIDVLGDQWPSEVALVHAFNGEADAAFAWLDQAIQQGEPGLGRISYSTYFRSLRDDPRWPEFMTRLGGAAPGPDAIPFTVRLPRA